VAVRRVVVVRRPILPGPAIVAGAAVAAVGVGAVGIGYPYYHPYPPYWRSMYCPPAAAPVYAPYGYSSYGGYGW
jgi:hypothetical protein